MPGPKPKQYTPEEVTAGLVALASEGSAAAAHRATGIPAETLARWKKETYAEQFREIEERYGRELEEQLVWAARTNARRAAEIEAQLIEKMALAGDREAPQALRAVTDAKTKNIDKLLSLTGRPSTITESRDIGSILKGLAERKVLRLTGDVDGTAEEIG